MQASNRAFANLIIGNKQFTIPVFQRDYSWTREQCLQMWVDIIRVSNENGGGHFFGSFVYVAGTSGAAFSRWLVIDGQQRLTALTLLLIALRDHIRATGWIGKGEDSPTCEQIDTYFLKNTLERGERGYRVALRRRDNSTIRALVDTKGSFEDGNKSESLMDSYRYFRELLNRSDSDPEQVYKGIGRLNIVDVSLERHIDNPQLIFESLNSTGVDLTESDLIRNYLLMGLPETEQTRLYDDYWSKLENLFQAAGSSPDMFLRDYTALRRKSTTQTRADRIYREFKVFWQEPNEGSLDERLDDMVKFARYYVYLLLPSRIKQAAIATAMRNLRLFGTTHATLIMRLNDYYDRNMLSEQDFIRALTLIHSYLLRRAVVGLQTRGYWVVFASIAHLIRDEAPFESFQVALARHHQSFPSNEAFAREIQERDIYGTRVCWHILDQLENANQAEPSPTGNYSIEHIMPQSINRSDDWKAMLGDNWKEVHETWLHRLGNLTLTAYNATYSNKSFEEKKAIPGGFEQSAVRLNQYVRNQSKWTAPQMNERGDMLAKRALEIWPHHSADEKLIKDADIRDLKNRAKRRRPEDLDIPDQIRTLLDGLRNPTKELGDVGDVIEIVENRSVCFYAPDFFAELLPMTGYVRLLAPLDFDDLKNPEGWQDANAYKFLPRVVHRECGVFIDISYQTQIPGAMLTVREAFTFT